MPLVVRTTGLEEYLDQAGQAHIKALILGEPSAGKTRSASFWPNPIFFDCEKGRMSLADRQVPYVEITSSGDMDAALRMLEIECATTAPAERKYKTLVIDTFDAYQRIVMQEILRQLKKESFTDYREWGQLDSKMQNLVARLHKLSMNIVVNVHTKSTKDGDDGPIVKEPKLKGDLREQISAEFDLVGYMATYWEAVNGERTLSRAVKWFPEPNMPILKDRSGQLPRYTPVTFTEDDYLSLFNAIYGGDHYDSLAAGEQVDSIETEEGPEPVAPHAGGPVQQKGSAKVAPEDKVAPRAEPAAKKAAKAAVPPSRRATPPVPPAKKTAPPATAPAAPPAQAAAPAAETVTEEPPARRSPPQAAFVAPEEPVAAALEDPEQTMEGAVAAVEEGLGGEVVSTERDVEPEQVQPPEPEAQPEPAAPEPTAPASGGVPCGTPVNANVTKKVPGCGKDTSALEGPEQDLVNIALIKTRHYLCPQCLGKWKNAQAAEKAAAK